MADAETDNTPTLDGVSEHAGFPNAATDSTLTSLNITKLLVKRPSSTFFMRVEGSAGEEMAIYNGDIVIIDRALRPRPHDVVVWWDEHSFVFSRARHVPKDQTSWGVITYIIHKMEHK